MLLYHLLTAVGPFAFEGKAPTERERMICEAMPPKPSAVHPAARALAGDLDSIVLRALRKEPSRRYESVDSFSEDIGRYLARMPVRAQPDTWRYRTSKFYKRHKLSVAVGAALTLLLGGGVFAIRRGVEKAQMVIADVEREQMGNLREALENIQAALYIARQLNSEFPDNKEYKVDLASILLRLGHTYRDAKDPANAIPIYLESCRIVDRLSAADPADARLRRSVATHNTAVAFELAAIGHLTEATARYRRSLSVIAALLCEDPLNVHTQDDFAYLGSALGGVLLQAHHVPEATSELKAAFAMREKLAASDPGNIKSRWRLALSTLR